MSSSGSRRWAKWSTWCFSTASHMRSWSDLTPLRLIACLSDFRTPPAEAEHVFIRLKKMGKVVDMVLFHGEPHALVVRSDSAAADRMPFRLPHAAGGGRACLHPAQEDGQRGRHGAFPRRATCARGQI